MPHSSENPGRYMQRFRAHQGERFNALMQNKKLRRAYNRIVKISGISPSQREKIFNNYVAFQRLRTAIRVACHQVRMPLSLQRRLTSRFMAAKGKLLLSPSKPDANTYGVRQIVLGFLKPRLNEADLSRFHDAWVQAEKEVSNTMGIDIPIPKAPPRRG